MSGLDPDTGEPIYYPGENRTKWEKIWEGSPMHGGGLSSMIGPILMIAGVTIFLLAVLT